MVSEIVVLTPSQVSSLEDDVDLSKIRNELRNYVKSMTSRINGEDLGDWRLLISVLSRPTNGIGIYKRVQRFPSGKEFEVSISIAIPDNEQASYGLSKVRNSFYQPLNDKLFYIINCDFEKYNNLYDYILDSSKCAINTAFTYGFTCGGKKIKFQK